MLPRVITHVCRHDFASCSVPRRLISKCAARWDKDSKPIQEEDQQIKDLLDTDDSPAAKTVYPNRRLHPKVLSAIIPEEAPWTRTFRAFKYDYDVTKNFIKGKMPPPFLDSSDILVIGGGFVGTSIAYHLTERTGPGLNVTVIEKDPPELSSTIKVARNSLYQQMKLKPNIEMAQYAAEFYRKLNVTFNDPDIPHIDVGFLPNNSLQLVPENQSSHLDDLSEMYKEVNWRHQVLTASMLKQRFPWMNVDGIGAGCLGLQKEGVCEKYRAMAAMRAVAKRNKVKFIQGEVIGFEFIDQSDLSSSVNEIRQYFSPRQAVIQTPSGDVIKNQFAYVIIAAGTSIHDVMGLLNVGNVKIRLPVQTQMLPLYEFSCPDGPGIEMPMIMESSGVKVRKSDLVNNYVVWDDKNCEYHNTTTHLIDVQNSSFSEKLLPQLINRVPCFKDAKLISSQTGLIDRSVWDDNILIGPLPTFHNVLAATGFGNDEFLFAPAVGQGIAELILDSEFVRIDLSCFRFERISSDIKLNMETSYM